VCADYFRIYARLPTLKESMQRSRPCGVVPFQRQHEKQAYIAFELPAKEHFVHNAIPLILTALMAVAIIVIGCFYLASPERIWGTFGLKPPASDADTRAWLRPKGIRDVAAGLVVLTMMLTADRRLVGIALLVEAIIPLGDMSIVLGSGGSKSRAF